MPFTEQAFTAALQALKITNLADLAANGLLQVGAISVKCIIYESMCVSKTKLIIDFSQAYYPHPSPQSILNFHIVARPIPSIAATTKGVEVPTLLTGQSLKLFKKRSGIFKRKK